MLMEQCIASLEKKEAVNESEIEMLTRKLQECKTQLAHKDQAILSLKAQAMEKVHSHCCANKDTRSNVTQEQEENRIIVLTLKSFSLSSMDGHSLLKS